jgi:hypothetical protein
VLVRGARGAPARRWEVARPYSGRRCRAPARRPRRGRCGGSEGLAHARDGALERLVRRKHRDAEGLVAEGDEGESSCGLEEGDAEWTARVFVVRSPAQAERQAVGRAKRLATAEQQRAALTPARGRGKRQSTEEATRVAALDTVLQEQQGEGLLQGAWQQQIERHTLRRSGTRLGHASTAGTEPIRSPRTRLTRHEGPSEPSRNALAGQPWSRMRLQSGLR